MSLYNMVHGVNPAASFVLGVLGVAHADVPRFRDAWIDPGTANRPLTDADAHLPVVEDEPKLVIYTRTGGGNREAYCVENEAMTLIPGYEGDHDDDFDSTYAEFRYAVPPAFADAVRVLVEIGGGKTGKPAEAWQRVIGEMQSGQMSEGTAAAVDAMKPLFDQITAAFDKQPPR